MEIVDELSVAAASAKMVGRPVLKKGSKDWIEPKGMSKQGA